ncbi:SIMPL domain-containing protein [Marinobacter sp.]|uniref:SIMPL domain-containing protein n=1 Tax=Marinobacter sp. TaxID=50741 RepID=UPI002B26E634|nr:SIMPL domain-containing protein [Marinobacter sp.]
MSHQQRAVALAAVFVAGAFAPALASAGEVSLSGEGIVTYSPDSARLRFTANAEHNEPAKASQQVHKMMEQWRKGIRTLQSQLDDYSDAELNLYTRNLPIQEKGQKQEQVAVASQTVSFTISDLALLNPLLEEAQKLGLQYHLGTNQFFHSEEQTLQQKALGLAIADAKAQCNFVAKQLDKSCGDVVTINVSNGQRPSPMMMSSARASEGSVSAVGPQEISAMVNATFELD